MKYRIAQQEETNLYRIESSFEGGDWKPVHRFTFRILAEAESEMADLIAGTKAEEEAARIYSLPWHPKDDK